MKEKLIELIQAAVGGCARYWAELIAKHLISNGVILKPDCSKCFYHGRIDSWQVCERCYGDKSNQFLDKHEVEEKGKS